MRTLIPLRSALRIALLFVIVTSVSTPTKLLGQTPAADTTCLDTFYVKYRQAASFTMRAFPACDSMQWRYAQADSLIADSLIADTMWVAGDVDTSRFVIDGLVPETGYVVQMRGVQPGHRTFDAWSGVFAQTRCLGPETSSISISELTHHSVTMNATGESEQWEWTLQRVGSSVARHVVTPGASFTWRSLNANQEYVWQVRRWCDGEWSDFSEVQTFMTKEKNNSDCEDLSHDQVKALEVTSSSVKLKCYVPGHKYTWHLRRVGHFGWHEKKTTSSQYHWTGLHPGARYEYKVRVECHEGTWSSWSSVHYFTTNNHYGPDCSTPKGHHLRVKDVTHNSASTYCDVRGKEYHWAIRKYGSTSWTHHTGTHHYNHWTHLKHGTKYQYKVKVKCHNGYWTEWSYVYHFTTHYHHGPDCSTPTSHHLTVKNITHRSASTHCSVDGKHYHWALKKHGTSHWKHYEGPSDHHDWTNLHANTKYYYKVKVKCHNGYWTDWSDVYYFTTKHHYGPSCSTPKSHHLSVKNLTHSGASTYCSVDGKEYHWAIRKYGTSDWTHKTTTHGYYHWTNLYHDTKYEYKVKVKCHNGYWTPWSYVYRFTTHHHGPDCHTPQSHHLRVSHVSHASATTHCSVSGKEYHWSIKPYGSSDWQHYTTTHGYHTWTHLHHDTRYVYKVKVKCHNGYWTEWSSHHYFTTHYYAHCSTPTSHDLSIQNLTYHSATTHCAVSGNEYHWSIKPYGANEWQHHTSSQGHYDWTNLHYGTRYVIKVKVKCHNGYWTGWSPYYYFTTHHYHHHHCSTPTSHDLSVQNLTHHSASTYCGVSGTKYHWSMRPYGSSTWQHYTSTHNYYNWTNLHYGTRYEYKVKVQCHNGIWTDWSYHHYFTTHQHHSDCYAPNSLFTAVQQTYNLFRVYFYGSFERFTSAIRQVGDTEWAEHTTTVNNVGWGNLAPNTQYEYRVKITCANWVQSEWSGIKTFWTGSPPSSQSGRSGQGSPRVMEAPGSLMQTSQPSLSEVTMYPTPARDLVTIQGAAIGSDVQVIDATGKVLLRQQELSGRDQLDVGLLQNGVYHVLITDTQGQSVTKKLVVVH